MSVRNLGHPAVPRGSGLSRTPGRAVPERSRPSPLSSSTFCGPGPFPAGTASRLSTSSPELVFWWRNASVIWCLPSVQTKSPVPGMVVKQSRTGQSLERQCVWWWHWEQRFKSPLFSPHTPQILCPQDAKRLPSSLKVQIHGGESTSTSDSVPMCSSRRGSSASTGNMVGAVHTDGRASAFGALSSSLNSIMLV
eukprot:2755510-Amphidinium_carterae.1